MATKHQATGTKKTSAAILGVGSLGTALHARIYSELEKAGQVQFSGIFDANPDTANKIAAKNGVKIFNSVSDAAANSDAANITANAHHDPFLKRQTIARAGQPTFLWKN